MGSVKGQILEQFEEEFTFCTLIPKTNGEFDPFSGVLEQTWYASIQGKIMEVSVDGVRLLLETRTKRYDPIPKVEKGREILVKNEDGTFAKHTVESLRRFEEGICIQYSGKFSADEYVLLEEYKKLWKLANEESF